MGAPYRTAGAVPATAPLALQYRPEVRTSDSTFEASAGVIAPILVAVIVAGVGFPDYALPAGVAALVGGLWWRRQKRKHPAAVLTLEKQVLRVVVGGTKMLEASLEEVLDVRLDTKTIERVQESTSGFPEARFINATVGPAIDIARIEIVSEGERVLLTREFHSHMDSTEWMLKIRKFLRAEGWKPAKERGAEVVEEPPPSKKKKRSPA